MITTLELVLPVVAGAFSILLFIVYFFKKKINLMENRMYSIMIICVLIDSILVFTEKFLVSSGDLDSIPIIVQNMVCLLNKIDAFVLITITSCLFRYIFVITLNRTEEQFKKDCLIVRIFNIAVFIIILLLDVHLITNGEIISISGTSLIPTYLACGIYVILSLIITLSNLSKITKRHIPLFAAIFIFLILIATFALNPYLTVISILLTLLNYIMYFTIENPDVQMIAKLETARV